MAGRTARRRIMHIDVSAPGAGETLLAHRPDLLAAEDPLEIRVDGRPLAVTMRTPGDDIDLAAGFLAGEGLVRSPSDIASIRICRESHDHHAGAGPDGAGSRGADQGNVAEVTLAADAQIDDGQVRRNFLTTSACGVCGKASIEAIRVRARYDVAADQARVDPRVLTRLPGRLHDAQRVFARTGGLHAAGLFTSSGELIVIREDVGRHNAVDKLVGHALLRGQLPLAGCALLVSGRASFELVQKAVLAGIPLLAAVSAPSSLAADLAEEAGLTLAGFLRGRSMNVYTHAHRIPT
jgi:FdhD protein